MALMHNETYDLSEAKISFDDVTINDASEFGMNRSTVSLKYKALTSIEAANDMDLYDEFDSRVAEMGGSSNIMGVRVNDKAQPAQTPVLLENQQGDGNVLSLDPTVDVAEARELHEFRSETIDMNVDVEILSETVVVNSLSTVDFIGNDAGNQTAGVIHFADITSKVDASSQVKPPVETTDQDRGVVSVETDANADADQKDLDIDVPVVNNVQKTQKIPLNEMETCACETDIQKNGVAHNESLPTTLLPLDIGECSTHILSDKHVMDERIQNDQMQLEEDMFLYAEAEYNAENLERGLCDVENIINSSDLVMVDVDLRNSTYNGNTEEADIDQVDYNVSPLLNNISCQQSSRDCRFTMFCPCS